MAIPNSLQQNTLSSAYFVAKLKLAIHYIDGSR